MDKKPENDLRYIKTEALIRETFRDMLKEMDYSKITIRELTERAKINRKTFYLHYGTLDDLLYQLQIEIYRDMFVFIEKVNLPADLDKLVEKLFTFSASVGEPNQRILSCQGNFPPGQSPADRVKKHMLGIYYPRNISSRYNQFEINLINAFLYDSLISIYSQWILDGRKIPLEDVISLTTKLILKGLDNMDLTG